jgi:hypothetical protein
MCRAHSHMRDYTSEGVHFCGSYRLDEPGVNLAGSTFFCRLDQTEIFLEELAKWAVRWGGFEAVSKVFSDIKQLIPRFCSTQ